MGIDIYGITPSPPCRAVFLVAKAIGRDYNLKVVDMMEKREHLSPEYLKMNPAHTVPVMKEGDLVLCESKAIITYFMNKYAADSSLYPKDPAARALVDQRLFFDTGLFASLKGIVFPVLFLKDLKQSAANWPKVEENLDLLEIFLTRSAYVAGQQLSIADLAVLANVSTMDCAGVDLSKWPHVSAWLAKLKADLPYYDQANAEGAKILGELYQSAKAELESK